MCIFSGGLGPTEDDLTRECVAEALGLELRRDHEVVAGLYARAARLRMRMPDNNVKQADYIVGAELLKNNRGSAPGQWLDTTYEGQRRVVVLLPGPPSEIEGMFNDHCFDRLKLLFPDEHLATRELKIAMVMESLADQRASKIYKEFPDVLTTILAKPGEVQLHLKARAATQEEAEARVEKLASLLEEEFADEIFATRRRVARTDCGLLSADARGDFVGGGKLLGRSSGRTHYQHQRRLQILHGRSAGVLRPAEA